MTGVQICWSPQTEDGKYVCKCCGYSSDDIGAFGVGTMKCWDCSMGTHPERETCVERSKA